MLSEVLHFYPDNDLLPFAGSHVILEDMCLFKKLDKRLVATDISTKNKM